MTPRNKLVMLAKALTASQLELLTAKATQNETLATTESSDDNGEKRLIVEFSAYLCMYQKMPVNKAKTKVSAKCWRKFLLILLGSASTTGAPHAPQ